MNSLLTYFYDSLRSDLGYPARLIRLINDIPELIWQISEQVNNIDAHSIVRWDKLNCKTSSIFDRNPQFCLRGWKKEGDYYHGITLDRHEFNQLSEKYIQKDWMCDITDVHGFSASKSDLRSFRTMDEMVEENSRSMIDEITDEKLAKNLAHKEIRIIHGNPQSDYFMQYAWDNRIFLMNSGGSHHFAAAKYIASRLSKPVTLYGDLHSYTINKFAIASLSKDFEIFVIGNKPVVSNEFNKAMQSFVATWFWATMPQPYTEISRAIFLPRNEVRSMRVAKILRKAGTFDLGKYLTELCATQTRHVLSTN